MPPPVFLNLKVVIQAIPWESVIKGHANMKMCVVSLCFLEEVHALSVGHSTEADI